MSILDGFEQSYIRLLSYVDTLSTPWIGLFRNNSNLTYLWSDDWPVVYTNWASGVNFTLDQPCVYFNSTSGEWILTDCNENRSFICKISTETPPMM